MYRYLLFATLIIISSCKSKTNAPTQSAPPLSEDYGAYILSHTQELVSIKDALTVRFAKDVVAESEIGKEVSKDLYQLKRSMKGSAFWQDQSTFVFRPTLYMQYDESFTLALYLHKLFENVPESQRVATIPFTSQPRWKPSRYQVDSY